MDSLISRQAAIDAVRNINAIVRPISESDDMLLIDQAEAMTELMMLPSAQPEQKKGRWIVKEKGCKLTSYKCSKCGRYIIDDTGYDVKKDYPFCHCGADMREDTDE